MAHGQSGAEIAFGHGPTLTCNHEAPIVAFDCKAAEPRVAPPGVAPTLRAMGHAGSHPNAGGQVAIAFDAQSGGETALAVGEDVAGALHGGGKHGGRAAVAFDMRGREGGAMPEGPHETANIRAASGGSSRSYVAFTQNSRSEVRMIGGDGSVVGALAADAGAQQQNYVASPWAVRRLLPVECERLQGFPDGYTDVPYGRRNRTPDGPRYKVLGNSMARNVMEWLGARIEHVEDVLRELGR